MSIERGRYMTRLQNMRLERVLTQVELSDQSQINLRSLQYYEQGKKDIAHVRLDKLLRLCLVLGCELSDIIDDPQCQILIKEYEKRKEAV